MIMKTKYFILILFLQDIEAKISINIEVGLNSSDITINSVGSDIKVIGDYERGQFHIEDQSLKEAAKNHYDRKPNDIYVRSPTPWGDLYQTYHWEQIKRILTVKSVRVKGITKKPVIVLSQDFENHFNNTIKVNTGITQTVENTVTTSWTRNKEIAITQEVEYDINVILGKVTGTTGFSYSTSWGESEEHSETISIGSSTGVETELHPGQKATAILTANRGYMEVEIVYMAFLRGNLAINFKKPYKGHHFHGPPIENVMKDGGLSNEVTATEIIKVGFYVDATLKVIDKASGNPL